MDTPDIPDLVLAEKAVRIVAAMERAICRLRLLSQGEFVALLNAIEVHLDDGMPDPAVVRHLCDALLALAQARGIDAKKLKLDQRTDRLLKLTASATSRG